ncbi:hypothetical protein DENSPDRAFT_418171 [Dentipellis sp. KUC8613]|nr:hypothetical protein DENSPDRAFT_418171 [Dentipellis sp. KUC8613]
MRSSPCHACLAPLMRSPPSLCAHTLFWPPFHHALAAAISSNLTPKPHPASSPKPFTPLTSLITTLITLVVASKYLDQNTSLARYCPIVFYLRPTSAPTCDILLATATIILGHHSILRRVLSFPTIFMHATLTRPILHPHLSRHLWHPSSLPLHPLLRSCTTTITPILISSGRSHSIRSLRENLLTWDHWMFRFLWALWSCSRVTLAYIQHPAFLHLFDTLAFEPRHHPVSHLLSIHLSRT